METTKCEKIDAGWFVFFTWQSEPETQVEMVRIGASCLGNAISVALRMASRSNIYIVGVSPDLGVMEIQ